MQRRLHDCKGQIVHKQRPKATPCNLDSPWEAIFGRDWWEATTSRDLITHWVSASQRVRSVGVLVVLSDSIGICAGGSGIVVASAVQWRVTAS